MNTDLLRDVERFCREKQMATTTFGKLSLNDAHFVATLRNGRRLWPETMQKIRDFMSHYSTDYQSSDDQTSHKNHEAPPGTEAA